MSHDSADGTALAEPQRPGGMKPTDTSDPDYFHTQLDGFVDRFGLTTEDLKNLTVSAALAKMADIADDGKTRGILTMLLGQAHRLGLAERKLNHAKKTAGV